MFDNIDNGGDIVWKALNERQIAILDEIFVECTVGLASFPAFRRDEGVTPAEPDTGSFFATENERPKKIVEAAAIEPYRQNL